MSKNTSNKNLAKASGVLLIHQGKIVEFFPQENINKDRNTGGSRGFGFVEMSSAEEAQTAISQLDGMEVNGRSLTVTVDKDAKDFVADFDINGVLDTMLEDFRAETNFCYRNIEESQREIEQLNNKSAKRQERFEIAIQKLEGLLNNE